MATMYVTEQGAQLEKEYGRLLVTKDDELLMRVPLARVSHVVLVGNIGVTTPAMIALLAAGVRLSLMSPTGQLRGRLLPPTDKNLPLRHQQYTRAQDAAFCLEVARAIVVGKLRNQRTLARRLCLSHPGADPASVQLMTGAIKKALRCKGMDELRGAEGMGARGYFAVLRHAVPAAWRPAKRLRRPPPDPMNALQSLGYTLLTQDLMAACEVVGLDPYDGFFHADKYGRPALALDLMEEFRSVIVDSAVLMVINKGMLTPADFVPAADEGVVLTSRGLKVFLHQYSQRINARVKHPQAGRPLTYQQCFEVQARAMAKAIQGENPYLPFRTR